MALGLALVACGGAERLPPAAPALETPADAIPPELDIVVRFDLARVRSAIGPIAIAAIKKELGEGDPSKQFLLDVLERTNVFVLAGRFQGASPQDAVIAAEGDYKELDPRKYPFNPAWEKAIDLGGDVRRFDRKKPKNRSDPARIYVRSNRLMVLVTEAAIDSVEAVVEGHRPGNSLRPPDRGIISLAIRLRPGNDLLRGADRFPMLTDALGGMRSIELSIDHTAKGMGLHGVIEFDTDGEAKTAGEILEAARGAIAEQKTRVALFARYGNVTAEGRHVVARVDMPLEVFGATLGDVLR
jgi:hypothetical protein